MSQKSSFGTSRPTTLADLTQPLILRHTAPARPAFVQGAGIMLSSDDEDDDDNGTDGRRSSAGTSATSTPALRPRRASNISEEDMGGIESFYRFDQGSAQRQMSLSSLEHDAMKQQSGVKRMDVSDDHTNGVVTIDDDDSDELDLNIDVGDSNMDSVTPTPRARSRNDDIEIVDPLFVIDRGHRTGTRSSGLRQGEVVSDTVKTERGKRYLPTEILQTLMQPFVTPVPTSLRLRGVPWVRAGGYTVGSKAERLTAEILDFCSFITPSAVEAERRRKCFESLCSAVASIWPHARVALFGSYDTGLFLPTSDIDVSILRSHSSDPLSELSKVLRRQVAKEIHLIRNARVPLIKYKDRLSGINVDISFDIENGPANTKIVKQFARGYPQLKPILLVIKTLLQLRGLNDTFTGGLGSYLLTNIVISHMQHRVGIEHMSLGEILIDWLDLYGNKFNYYTTGISILDGGCYYAKAKMGWMNPQRPFLVSVMDPQNPESDIGRNSFKLPMTRQAFSDAVAAYDDYKPEERNLNMQVSQDECPPSSLLSTILWGSVGSAEHDVWLHSEFTSRFGLKIDHLDEIVMVTSEFAKPAKKKQKPGAYDSRE